MSQVYVSLPYDPTGTSPDNHVGSEKRLVQLYDGLPYGMITLVNGGFYLKGLRVYDKDYKPLAPGTDYIVTYHHKLLSDKLGLDIASGIVFLKPVYVNQLTYVSGQMVGGDAAYSFSVVDDYVAWYKTQPVGYVPARLDYVGVEPIWGPGELLERRWGLDMFQPYVMELDNIGTAITAGPPELETEFRSNVKEDFEAFKARFNDRLDIHIRDEANPHQDLKAHADLGNVINHPLATAAIARQGLSDQYYLTPQLASFTVDTNAETPLTNHIARINQDPHGLTPALVNAYPSADSQAQVTSKYTVTERVANALELNVNGTYMSLTSLVTNARLNWSTLMFDRGLVNPARMAFGTPTYDTLLRGNRQWTTWESLVQEYIPVTTAAFYRMAGTYTTDSAILQMVNTLYANAQVYPVGTVVMAYLYAVYAWGTGNGGIDLGVTHNRVCLRTAGGWIYTGYGA